MSSFKVVGSATISTSVPSAPFLKQNRMLYLRQFVLKQIVPDNICAYSTHDKIGIKIDQIKLCVNCVFNLKYTIFLSFVLMCEKHIICY